MPQVAVPVLVTLSGGPDLDGRDLLANQDQQDGDEGARDVGPEVRLAAVLLRVDLTAVGPGVVLHVRG